jgi:hypothetical protein
MAINSAYFVAFGGYCALFVMNLSCLVTIYVFPVIFQQSRLSRIISNIHFYDLLNAFLNFITFRADTGTFRCNLCGYGCNVVQICVFFWVAILSVKLSVIVQPSGIAGFIQGEFWDDIGSNLRVHAWVVMFSIFVSLLSRIDYEMSSYHGAWCWLDDGDSDHKAGTFILWNFVSFFFWGGAAALMSTYFSLATAYNLQQLVDIPYGMKSRFNLFLLYPIALVVNVTFFYLDLVANKESALFNVFVPLVNIGYTIGFWLIFRAARMAWVALLKELLTGESGSVASLMTDLYAKKMPARPSTWGNKGSEGGDSMTTISSLTFSRWGQSGSTMSTHPSEVGNSNPNLASNHSYDRLREAMSMGYLDALPPAVSPGKEDTASTGAGAGIQQTRTGTVSSARPPTVVVLNPLPKSAVSASSNNSRSQGSRKSNQTIELTSNPSQNSKIDRGNRGMV